MNISKLLRKLIIVFVAVVGIAFVWGIVAVANATANPQAAVTINYSYDDAGRLTQADYDSGDASIDYTYDDNGNLLQRLVTGGAPTAVGLQAIATNMNMALGLALVVTACLLGGTILLLRRFA